MFSFLRSCRLRIMSILDASHRAAKATNFSRPAVRSGASTRTVVPSSASRALRPGASRNIAKAMSPCSDKPASAKRGSAWLEYALRSRPCRRRADDGRRSQNRAVGGLRLTVRIGAHGTAGRRQNDRQSLHHRDPLVTNRLRINMTYYAALALTLRLAALCSGQPVRYEDSTVPRPI